MIVGIVNADREATLLVTIIGSSGQIKEVEAVIDTGFTGYLTLPAAVITELGLPFAGREQATLADGSTLLLDVHSATVHWDGQGRRIEVDSAETAPLVGMGLLYGFRVTMEVLDAGSVTIIHI
jgi:clan AA aspartic protease